MSDTPVETADLAALRAEVDQLRAEVASEKQRQAEALSAAENGYRAQRLLREKADLQAELAAIRGTAMPTSEVSAPQAPAEIPSAPLDPVTLRALPVDPDRPVIATEPTPAEVQPEASTDTATKRR